MLNLPCSERYNDQFGACAENPMENNINYNNNPLHGIGLKQVITEIVNYYGFDILFSYLNINCFNSNPSIDSSVKFLKKTDWAREKVEAFYLYQFKSLPRASAEQFELPPRDRIIPESRIAFEYPMARRCKSNGLTFARGRSANWTRRPGPAACQPPFPRS